MEDAGESRPDHARPWERFEGRAAAYARWRPGYPEEAFADLLEGLGAPNTLHAADVGAGTGISARALAERGVTVTAVEPNAEMRAEARPHPRVTWVEGAAEATGLASASQDLVLCAQSFHWFDAPAALAEFRRILRPGGRLALLWNVRLAGHPLVDAYAALVESVATTRVPHSEASHVGRVMGAAGFLDVERRGFQGGQRLDAEGLVGRALSTSYAPQGGPPRERLVAGLRALHARHADGQAQVLFPYAVTLWRARSPGPIPSAAP